MKILNEEEIEKEVKIETLEGLVDATIENLENRIQNYEEKAANSKIVVQKSLAQVADMFRGYLHASKRRVRDQVETENFFYGLRN